MTLHPIPHDKLSARPARTAGSGRQPGAADSPTNTGAARRCGEAQYRGSIKDHVEVFEIANALNEYAKVIAGLEVLNGYRDSARVALTTAAEAVIRAAERVRA